MYLDFESIQMIIEDIRILNIQNLGLGVLAGQIAAESAGWVDPKP